MEMVQRFNKGTSMRRIGSLIVVLFSAVFVFLLALATDGSSATMLFERAAHHAAFERAPS